MFDQILLKYTDLQEIIKAAEMKIIIVHAIVLE